MNQIRRFLRTILLGTLVGAVLSAWFSPGLITYWFSPPVDIALTCRPAVEWGLEAYRKMLLLGGALGLVVTLVFVIGKSARAKHHHPAPTR